MKKVFRALLVCMLVAALAATSFIIPVSAAKVDEGSSVGTIFEGQRVRSYDKRVVYIENNVAKKCFSGCIFAKNAILTCVHGVMDNGCVVNPSSLQVYPGGKDGQSYKVKKIIFDRSVMNLPSGDIRWYPNKDWAILETEDNIGDKYGYFDFSSEVTTNDTLTNTGYPGDKGCEQYTESGKKAIDVKPLIITHYFSTYGGSSGSPLYKSVNGKAVVVGLITGGDCARRIDEELYNTMMKIRNKHYYIEYHADDVSSSKDDIMNETVVSYGTATPLRKNTYAINGCHFIGWTAYRRSDYKWCYKNPTTGKPEWYTIYNVPVGWEKYIYYDEQLTAAASGTNGDTIDMYAQWSSGSSYTIEYKANGGKGTMNTTTVNYGVSTKLSANTFTYGSRKLLGWIATRNGLQLYENPKNPSETKWCLPGYDSAGWQDHIFKDGDAVYNLTGVDGACVTMTAQWSSPTACTIYYDSNGGNGNMEPTVIEYSSISGKLSKNTFTKDNYNFVGWTVNYINRSSIYWLYENPEKLSEKGWYSEESAPEGWTKHIYKDCDAFEPNSKHDKYKITMCAQWEENNNPPTYTINYNANGGSGTMDSTQGTCNVPTKLAKNTFTNGENKFAGWSAHRSSDDKWFYRNPKNGAYSGWYKENSQPVGWTKALYSNGCYVTISSDFKNDKITLYAQWKKIGTNLSINNTTEVIKGDVNGDGALTINDVTKLQRYLAEFESFNDKQMKAADVNNDGEVSVKDITAMQCLINN